jgi:hypothetical protein
MEFGNGPMGFWLEWLGRICVEPDRPKVMFK